MDLIEIRDLLIAGGCMLYETDTILGLGCDARCEMGIKRINLLKQRPDYKSYIVLVSNLEMLTSIIGQLSEKLAEKILGANTPTTFIFPKYQNLPLSLSGHNGSLAIRLTQNKRLQEFIHYLGFPLVSTSVNLSGQPSAKILDEVDSSILEGVDYILPLKFEGTQKASRIVKIHENGTFITIRD